MCIKILKDNIETSYDSKKTLSEQVSGSEQILVHYEPFDKDIDSFLKEIENLANTGATCNLNIKVIHNDNIFGFKLRKKLRKATSDITVNEIIKLMVLSHAETDKKLSDLSDACIGKNCNE